MTLSAIVAAAVLLAGSSVALSEAQGLPPGVRRIDLQRHDLSIAGREVVQVRVELDAGVEFGRHSHPGEEIVNVLEGSLEYRIDGKPPVTLHAGGVLFIPAGAIHAAKNVGSGNGAELATYIVEKGKPLVVMATPADGSATPAIGVAEEAAIRPFRVDVAAADLAELKRRLAATRWPDKETVSDRSQGAPLALLQELVRYWATGYDWRKAEATLNAHPQFTTRIDGVDIHFIHVRSRHPNALPVLISHGWPGSVFEQIKLIGPLTDPTRFGGRAEDAFDVVIPSLPGFGFSARPTEAGWGLERIGQSFDLLMKRLGYTRYVAQGGDWGSGIVQAMARRAPTGLLGIHTNLPSVIPGDVAPALGGAPLPEGLSEQERAVVDTLRASGRAGNRSYVQMMNARPQAVAYGMTDSPAGLAAWMLVHPGFAHWAYGEAPAQSPTRDDVLDNVTLYWLTNSAASAARIYWENRGRDLLSATAQHTSEITVPVAITVFPDEVFLAPETWARRAFKNLIYFHHADRGGHFAAWEHPEVFAVELRAAFRTLRDATSAPRPGA
jgi:quercetin dioxygenase-like cupin family protein/pimeloyl-ACP methyl ester carboxylesterase